MTDQKPDLNASTRIKHAMKLHEMPQAKWRATLQRAVLGGLFIGLGVVMRTEWGMWPTIGLVGFGAHIFSNQIVGGTAKAFLDFFKSFKKAEKGDG